MKNVNLMQRCKVESPMWYYYRDKANSFQTNNELILARALAARQEEK
jgi:hypothetical protein